MLAARIVHQMYAGSLFASGMRGRWNSAGNKVIYASESIPLAFLENMVRRQGVGFNRDFRIMMLRIPDDAIIETVDITRLDAGWRDPNDYSQCQPLGDAWFNAGKALVLKVPSAVMPQAFNYVINTIHPEFHTIELAAVTELVPDDRIEGILRSK